MSLSVALCTYNGERYLPAQLASLAAQSRPPDELVACDDASTDDSVAVLRRFAAEVPFPVRIEANPTNLGSTANFAKAIGLCSGDVIALCDQDDVWLPGKLAEMDATLTRRPDAGLVFGNAVMVDQDGVPLGHTLWDAIEFRPAERRRFATGGAFGCMLRRFRVTGATTAFRSRFRDLILPIPAGWVHDAWIALLVGAVAPLVPIDEPLLEYRQHPRQQIGGNRRGLLTQYRVARAMGRAEFRGIADRFAEALDRLQGRPGVSPESLSALAGKVRHAESRARMRDPGAWRLPRVLGEWFRGNYSRYSRGWKAVAQDLILP